MVSKQNIDSADVMGMLYQDCKLMEIVAAHASGTLGDLLLKEKANQAKNAVEFIDRYFRMQYFADTDLDGAPKEQPDCLEKDLEELKAEKNSDLLKRKFSEKILKFQLDSEFSCELVNVIYGRKKPEQVASRYMTGYRAIFFDMLKILGCTPDVVFPRLAFLRASESIDDVLKSLPDNTEHLKIIFGQLAMHAIIYGNAIMAEENLHN